MNFIELGTHEIWDGHGEDGGLIAKAAKTCYRSEDTSTRTNEGFVKMLKANTHLAMLEFSWFPLYIEPHDNEITYWVANFFQRQKHFIATQVIEEGKAFIVSANGRAWFELLREYSNKEYKVALNEIIYALKDRCTMLFDEFDCSEKGIDFYNMCYVLDNLNGVDDVHKWVAVKFNNVSRGFTHELVRHRVMSFAQVSTRYVDMSNFNFVFPVEDFYSDAEKNFVSAAAPQYNLNDIQKTIEDIANLYEHLISKGFPKEYIRQLLPTGIAGEICVAGRVSDWKKVFELRCTPKANWEIRRIMEDLRNEFVQQGII